MSARIVRLLHVEDDPVQQRLVSLNLRGMDDYGFDIARAVSEDEAISHFVTHGAEILLLDYHLSQGNGLNVLERIRSIDVIVPVIAISGEALAATAADLLRAGADDFIYKRNLTQSLLTASIKAALTRAEQIRRRISTEMPARLESIEDAFGQMCADLVSGPCQAIAAQIERFEIEARKHRVNSPDLRRLFDAAEEAQAATRGGRSDLGRRLLQLMFLDLQMRLFNDTTLGAS